MQRINYLSLRFIFVAAIITLIGLNVSQPSAQASSKKDTAHPLAGEIRINGEIRAINEKTGTLIIIAKSYVLPNGKQVALSDPKLKTAILKKDTSFISLKDASVAVLPTEIFEWMNISVTGADLGAGKPIPARIISVDTNTDVPSAPTIDELLKESKASPLVTAVILGDNEEIERLLGAGVAINEKDEKGSTPLFTASAMNQEDTVRLLIKRGADVNAYNHEGHTALTFSAAFDNPEITELLIKSGADANAITRRGFTALRMATGLNKISTAKVLLNNGANPNKRTRLGSSILQLAQDHGYEELEELLLEKGAKLEDEKTAKKATD